MPTDDAKLTPAMKQFHQFKARYPDAVLFFRMGDFYETFYEDARLTARVCGLTLTARSKGDNPIPLAGVPWHALDGYLRKMLQAGHKVAICEQVEDPKTAVGVVKRDVVRVVTSGTLTDDILLDEKKENYLCAVHLGRKSAAIAWVDISTGHFYTQTVSEKLLLDEALKLSPAECLIPQMRGQLFEGEFRKLASEIKSLAGAAITERPSWYFDQFQAGKRLLSHFGTATLEGFGISDGDEAICPAGAIIEYLGETQKTSLGHIASLKKLSPTRCMQIDPTSLRSLEILRTIRGESHKGSLLECLDATLTGPGARLFRSWLCMPLVGLNDIRLRQDAVEELIREPEVLVGIRKTLNEISDLERIAARVATSRATPRDILALGSTLGRVPALKAALNGLQAELLRHLACGADPIEDLASKIASAIEPDCPTHLRDGGVMRSGYNPQLDRLRSISRDGQSWITSYQQQESQRTGISNLKVGFNKVFGYYIEITNSMSGRVPANYIRKQTVKNAERFITDELKQYEEQVLTAEEKSLALEQRLFAELVENTAGYIDRLQKLAEMLANLDCLAGLAHTAARRNYVRPHVTDSSELSIIDGRHPVLAESLGSEFVPNDIELGDGRGDVIILTGPNMAGKSTYIRQAALLVLMAQAGSFIPAKSATIGLVDRIFTRVGASDELIRGQSTFMVEMTETANIINNATDRSLVILDEVGRGTSTWDGLALAWAITEYLATTTKARTLFATHYHELTQLAELFVNVRNANVAVREWMDEVVFLHKILPGGTDKSYGIHVAKLAGLPRSITARSACILEELQTAFAKEAAGDNLTRFKTRTGSPDSLFVEKNKSVLDRLAAIDLNNLTPIEAINLLHQVKKELA
ncbi:MAG TPA: DNA mismatch repair protein MutS [Sedimentisphaerales bacterium]|nr:DNA mismatch repair protein MutS [Sedimentisphaerales bacterium]